MCITQLKGVRYLQTPSGCCSFLLAKIKEDTCVFVCMSTSYRNTDAYNTYYFNSRRALAKDVPRINPEYEKLRKFH